MISFLTGLDMPVLQYLVAHRDIATSLFFIGVTELGSTVLVVGVALCGGLVLALRHKIVYALALAVSVLGAGATALVVKEVVGRARPARAFQAYQEIGLSFPSGHATLAASFYGFLIYLAWRMLPPGWVRTTAVSILALLIAAIAFSRLYLGVHYLSDVLGGLLLGALFAYLGAAFVRKMERRG